jgi:hypothetical protein
LAAHVIRGTDDHCVLRLQFAAPHCKRLARQIALRTRTASGKPARLLFSIAFQSKPKRKLSDKSRHAWPEEQT